MSPSLLLDRQGIGQRIPHAGPMCLLDGLLAWSDDTIECQCVSHSDPTHPLRSASGLLAPAAIELAAQAMALHGALTAERENPNASPRPGFLASVRGVTMHTMRLDTVEGALLVRATRNAAQGSHVLYDFSVSASSTSSSSSSSSSLSPTTERVLVRGRAAVVLDASALMHAAAPPPR